MAHRSPTIKRVCLSLSQYRSYSAPAERSIPAAKQKYVPTTGTYPKGFLAGSAHAGVKASNTKYDDVALIISEKPCPATAIFTRNLFKAAPVTVSRDLLEQRRSEGFRGVVVNSGCANAVTGIEGRENARAMSTAADACAGVTAEDVPQTLVMSTGVIGQQLPIDKITSAIPKAHAALGSDHQHWMNAAQAICTTDTFPKLISRTFTLPSHPDTTYSIAGMTKGAGMIHPNMATLLAIVCTDAAIHPESMQTILRKAAETTFNSISVDGDTSTNDTVAFFANAAAAPEGVEPLVYPQMYNDRGRQITGPDKPAETTEPDQVAFLAALTDLMRDLAKLIVRDGEGATKFVTIRVRSDYSTMTARRAAVSIATSSLVKTALYGKDANWGRILCAIGYAPMLMDSPEIPMRNKPSGVKPENTSVSFIPADGSEELRLLVRGEPEKVDEARAKQILEVEDLEILVNLDDRPERTDNEEQREAVFWTCDFSHEYVTINGDYRT
ncbi:Arginine biosynthesis bifunctional protein ArgJ, mitochondrial [Oleoguttula sp. CCFEE 5521]